MKLIYPALTTASLMLTASPSFGLSREEIAPDFGLFAFVVNAIACLGIVSLVPNTIAMLAALKQVVEVGGFWETLKFMLMPSLAFPSVNILIMSIFGFALEWTDLLSIAIQLNIAFIVVSVPYLAFISHK